MFLVVGLGNPGDEYRYTKHNSGFLIIDRIANKLGIEINKKKFKGLIAQKDIKGEKVIFLKPQTYMNLSGESIIEVVNYYKIPKENVIIIYDDIDIEIGKMRIKREGSAGTHNGMRSIVANLHTEKFPRIRIGIKQIDNEKPIIDYVLSNFNDEQIKDFDRLSDQVYDTILNIIDNNIEKAMNKYN